MSFSEHIGIDIGSTFTKGALFTVHDDHLELTERLEYPTDRGDVSAACVSIFHRLSESAQGDSPEIAFSSSAHGGLNMVAIGIVPRYTEKLAREAALSAGAKLCGSFGYYLTEEDCRTIENINPDIILLTGGTDGGNMEYVLKNAHMLSQSEISSVVVYAGNRSAKSEVEKILSSSEQFTLYMCENILPQIDEPSIKEVRSVIKEVFMNQIMKGKGLSRARDILGCEPIPTPGSLFSFIERISTFDEYEHDWALVDIGGATTDCYSVVKEPLRSLYDGVPVFGSGVKELQITRSVEGDIGLRLNSLNLCELIDDDTGLKDYAELVTEHIEHIPQNAEQHRFENLLASSALSLAVKRHSGLLSPIYSVDGQFYRQLGKDLSTIEFLLVSGGVARRAEMEVFFDTGKKQIRLVPDSPVIKFDKDYQLPLLSVIQGVSDKVLAEYFWNQILSKEKGA